MERAIVEGGGTRDKVKHAADVSVFPGASGNVRPPEEFRSPLLPSLLALLACSAAPEPSRAPSLAPPPSHWPVDPAATAGACAEGSRPDCSALLSANRRSWARAVVQAGDGSVREDESRREAAEIIAAAACAAGDGFACLGPQRKPEIGHVREEAPFDFAMTFVDPEGVPLPGIQVMISGPERGELWAYLDTDVQGRVMVPAPSTGATVHRLAPAGLSDYSGAITERVVLDTPSVFGTSADHSLLQMPADDGAWGGDAIATLTGKWKRQPNMEADRQRPGWITPNFEIPGATGGVAPPDSPPSTLKFSIHGDGPDRVHLQGGVVDVRAGDGLVRVDRAPKGAPRTHDLTDLIYPVDKDCFVFVASSETRWSWPEVYRRE